MPVPLIRPVDFNTDALALVDAAHDLARRVVFWGLLPDKEDEFVHAVSRVVSAEGMEILVADHDGELVGAIGVLYVPYIWNPAKTTAEHVFLWAALDAPYGTARKLVDAAMLRIRDRAAIPVFHMLKNGPKGLIRLYRRHGLEPSDTAFMTRIN